VLQQKAAACARAAAAFAETHSKDGARVSLRVTTSESAIGIATSNRVVGELVHC